MSEGRLRDNLSNEPRAGTISIDLFEITGGRRGVWFTAWALLLGSDGWVAPWLIGLGISGVSSPSCDSGPLKLIPNQHKLYN